MPELLSLRYWTEYPRCNFSCEYCITGHGEPMTAAPWDGALYRRIVANIAKLPYRLRIRLGVSGEFFLNHDLVDGARELSNASNIEALNLITNLSLPLAQFERMFEDFQLDKVALVASFHPSQVRDHAAWFQTAVALAQRMDFCAMLVAYPPFLEQLPQHVAHLRGLGIETFVQPFIGHLDGKIYPKGYSRAEYAAVRSQMYSQHDIDYLLDLKKPGHCNAGYRAVFVHSSGRVYPCGAGVYEEPLGDFSASPELRLAAAPQNCPFRMCQCDTDTINAVDFDERYRLTGLNQHKYVAIDRPRGFFERFRSKPPFVLSSCVAGEPNR